MLITANELMDIHEHKEVRIFDCRYSLLDTHAGVNAYANGHITGARYLDLGSDLSGPMGPNTGRHPLPDRESFPKAVGNWGITDDSTVIAYDDGLGAMAARLWWLLLWLGHADVRVLDGGIRAWKDLGGDLVCGREFYTQDTLAGRPDNGLWIGAKSLESMIRTGESLIIDAREEKRYLGKEEPIDSVAGHIPGSINRPFTHNLSDKRFKPSDILCSEFSQLLGKYSSVQVIHSCGSGVTACHNLLAMEVAGLSGSRLYAGSWSEWITDPNRPVITIKNKNPST